jgi:subtilisin family serine protease
MKILISILIGTLFIWVSEAIQTKTNTFQHHKFKTSEQSNKYIIPGRFLVEFTTSHDNDVTQNNDIITALETKFQAMDLKVGDLVYSSTNSNIRTMHINDAALHDNFLETLVDNDNVVAVYPVTYIARPQAIANGFYSQVDTEVTQTIQAHNLTQIDRLHNELSLTGKGIKICIIDTGVDYMHPALGGGFGPNYTISFGADFVGDHFDPMALNNTTPDENATPLDNCSKLNSKSSKKYKLQFYR